MQSQGKNSEEWKPITGHQNYEVSNFGNIRNANTDKILKTRCKKDDRYDIIIDGVSYLVHRLVAQEFIKNNDPKNKDQINHKDGDPSNNHVDNLEWCTQSENNKHASATGLNPSQAKAVLQYEMIKEKEGKKTIKKKGKLMAEYPSIVEAGKALGKKPAPIGQACKGGRYSRALDAFVNNKTAYGFYWEYKDKDNEVLKRLDEKPKKLYRLHKYPDFGVTEEGDVYGYNRKRFAVLQTHADGYRTGFKEPRGNRKQLFVHTVMADTYLENPDPTIYTEVGHIDGNKKNNHLDNLEWRNRSGTKRIHKLLDKPKATLDTNNINDDDYCTNSKKPVKKGELDGESDKKVTKTKKPVKKDESDDESDKDVKKVKKTTSKKPIKKDESSGESDNDVKKVKKADSKRAVKKTTSTNKTIKDESSDSESEKEVKTVKKVKTKTK